METTKKYGIIKNKHGFYTVQGDGTVLKESLTNAIYDCFFDNGRAAYKYCDKKNNELLNMLAKHARIIGENNWDNCDLDDQK